MKTAKRNPTFRIAEVAIEIKEDGTPLFWTYNYGFHPGQGGMEFVYGNSGTESLEGSLDMLKMKLLRDVDHILKVVEERAKEIAEKEKE